MDDLTKAAVTALFAICVYTVGKLIERAWIDPVLEVRKTVGDIAFTLMFYANVSAETAQAIADHDNVDQGQAILDKAHEGSKALREQAAHLQARTYTVPAYGIAVRLGLLPPLEKVEQATGALIGYSNTINARNTSGTTHAERYRQQIEAALGIGQRRSTATPPPNQRQLWWPWRRT